MPKFKNIKALVNILPKKDSAYYDECYYHEPPTFSEYGEELLDTKLPDVDSVVEINIIKIKSIIKNVTINWDRCYPIINEDELLNKIKESNCLKWKEEAPKKEIKSKPIPPIEKLMKDNGKIVKEENETGWGFEYKR